MNPTLVYLSGPPAAGKSTLMAALTSSCTRQHIPEPLAHDQLTTPGLPATVTCAEIGRRRDRFSGTDALPLHAHPAAVRWLQQQPYTLLLAEGDRLATITLLLAAADAGYDTHLVTLETPADVREQRCRQRGSAQNARWIKGRHTKALRLDETARLDPQLTAWQLQAITAPNLLAAQLAERIPVLSALL